MDFNDKELGWVLALGECKKICVNGIFKKTFRGQQNAGHDADLLIVMDSQIPTNDFIVHFF
ncbi:MAG: hypothetical protein VB135_03400 [Burkholderia sp.]